jgi:ribosomal protein S18 acetylase RimI-like enzyme
VRDVVDVFQNSFMAKIRRVGVADLEQVRAIRIRALLDAPAAFGSTYEREASLTPEAWATRLARTSNAHFVASDGAPVGMVAIVRDVNDDDLAWLVGMWVDPDARGTGIADELIATALDWAETEQFTGVRLHVTEGNGPAERLYVRHGFYPTGESFDRDRDGATEIEMHREIGSKSR